jgi:spore germination protein YaaH
MTSTNNNEFHRPIGYETILTETRVQNKPALLMVSVESKIVSSGADAEPDENLSSYIISHAQLRQQLVSQIAAAAADYDGVAIDFENLKGEKAREYFTTFLNELKSTLNSNSRLLYVAVQPKRERGRDYFDGYDFQDIGKVADRVILMAHDYYAKSLTKTEMESGFNVTPLTPINEIYYALRSIIDPADGVQDKSKAMLQFSFDSVQWKMLDGKITNETPFHPSYDAIQARIDQGAIPQYSLKYESPFITFINEEDGTDNIIWYENERSISAKLKLASLFGINSISLWRLGIIPEDIASLLNK